MKKIIALLLALVMVLGLAACGNNADAPAADAPAADAPAADAPAADAPAADAPAEEVSLEGKKIAVIQKGAGSNYWVYAEAGSWTAAEEVGVEIQIFSPTSETDSAGQLDMIYQAVAQQVDVICLAPNDSNAVVPGIEAANEAGIPVILYSNTANGGKVESIVHISDYEAQYLVTKPMCEALKDVEYGQVICLEGTAGQQNARDKGDGAAAAIAEYPNLELVASQACDWNQALAYSTMQNLIQAYPDLVAVAACNDNMAIGALQALDEAGYEPGEVLIVGMNGDPTACGYVDSGAMFATLDNMPYELGYEVVMAAVRILKGETLEADIWLTPMLITTENTADAVAKRENAIAFVESKH